MKFKRHSRQEIVEAYGVELYRTREVEKYAWLPKKVKVKNDSANDATCWIWRENYMSVQLRVSVYNFFFSEEEHPVVPEWESYWKEKDAYVEEYP